MYVLSWRRQVIISETPYILLGQCCFNFGSQCILSKYTILTQCFFNVGQSSTTLGQHQNNTGWMSLVCSAWQLNTAASSFFCAKYIQAPKRLVRTHPLCPRSLKLSSHRSAAVQHLYNAGPTSLPLDQHCITGIQIFVFAGLWLTCDLFKH